MQRRVLGVLIACLVTAIAISAVAFGPAALRDLGSPKAPGQTGTGPQATSIERPTWYQGDTWTYTVNTTSAGLRPDGPSASGSLTRTVVSADASRDNVSLAGSFHIRWMVDVTPAAGMADASRMVACGGMFENATLGGYTWYQASDLAIIKEVRTLEVGGSTTTPMGTYRASYKAAVETTFDPALKVWSFPLQANETWRPPRERSRPSRSARAAPSLTWRATLRRCLRRITPSDSAMRYPWSGTRRASRGSAVPRRTSCRRTCSPSASG